MNKQIESIEAEKARLEGKLKSLDDQIAEVNNLIAIANREAGGAVLDGKDPLKVKGDLDQLENKQKMLMAAKQTAAERIQKIDQDLAAANAEQAKKDAEELGKEADALIIDMAKRMGKIAQDGRRLAQMEGRANGLGYHPGTALKHVLGNVIYQDAINTLEKMQSVGGEVKEILRNSRK